MLSVVAILLLLLNKLTNYLGSFCLCRRRCRRSDCCFPTRCQCVCVPVSLPETLVHSLTHLFWYVIWAVSATVRMFSSPSFSLSFFWCRWLLARMSVNWPPLPTFASIARSVAAKVSAVQCPLQCSLLLEPSTQHYRPPVCMDMANLLAHKVVVVVDWSCTGLGKRKKLNQWVSEWVHQMTRTVGKMGNCPASGHQLLPLPAAGHCSFAAVASAVASSKLAFSSAGDRQDDTYDTIRSAYKLPFD